MKSQFPEKIQFFSLTSFRFLYYLETYTTPHYRISLYYLLRGRWREERNFKCQTFTSNSAREVGRLQEVSVMAIWLGNFWYFGIVVAQERWSLTSGGRNLR